MIAMILDSKNLVFNIIYPLIIDPPSGWQYGFPKLLTQWHGQSLEDWLREQGYPVRLMESGLRARYWANSNRLLVGECLESDEEILLR